MNASFCLLLGLAALTAATASSIPASNAHSDENWQQFKKEYGKVYHSDQEERLRKSIFLQNKQAIDRHNELAAKNMTSFTMGVNAYSDLTSEEFQRTMKSFIGLPAENSNLTLLSALPPVNLTDLPDNVDWRNRNCVTQIKNQGSCNSDWAFSAAGAIEACHALAKGNLVSLSEQQLLDCSGNYGNNGCGGGLPTSALKYVKDHGIQTESSYRYESRQGSCRANGRNIGAKISGWREIPSGSESHLAEAVARHGPVTVMINLVDSFRHYRDGIYFDSGCNRAGINHALLVVGYGHGYYLAKNSWGTSFGENGYIKMSRNRSNNCKIASRASYPTGCGKN